MIETIILQYLASKLEVGVYAEVPDNPPSEFVIIEKIGSSRANKTRSATFAIQTHSETLQHTAELNEEVINQMLNIVELDKISSCRLDRDYNFTDTTTKRYRYQALFILTYY